jgi:hypothetical protein
VFKKYFVGVAEQIVTQELTCKKSPVLQVRQLIAVVMHVAHAVSQGKQLLVNESPNFPLIN